MKLTIAVISTMLCMAYAIPVPEESIDLVKIPLSGDRVSIFLTFLVFRQSQNYATLT